jgi:hypothetical protein
MIYPAELISGHLWSRSPPQKSNSGGFWCALVQEQFENRSYFVSFEPIPLPRLKPQPANVSGPSTRKRSALPEYWLGYSSRSKAG